MELTFPWASSHSKALDLALARASAKPLPPLVRDRFHLEGPLPLEFKRHAWSYADRFRISVNPQGCVFAIDELYGQGGGGFGGTCIPVSALIALLNLWSSQQTDAPPVQPIAPMQGELF